MSAQIVPFPRSAIDVACDHVTREFSRPGLRQILVVRAWLKHERVTDGLRVKYGWLARLVQRERYNFAHTIALLGHYRRMAAEMRRAGQKPPIAVFVGCDKPGMAEHDILTARLALRWLRRYRRNSFTTILNALAQPFELRGPTVFMAHIEEMTRAHIASMQAAE